MAFEGFDSPNDKDIVKRLKDYFDNTSEEKIQEDWRKTAKYDSVGMTCKEFSDRFLQPKQKEIFEIVYTYEGEDYIIIDDTIPFKHPESRAWIPAFTYMQLSSGKKFQREQKEFLELFKPRK